MKIYIATLFSLCALFTSLYSQTEKNIFTHTPVITHGLNVDFGFGNHLNDKNSNKIRVLDGNLNIFITEKFALSSIGFSYLLNDNDYLNNHGKLKFNKLYAGIFGGLRSIGYSDADGLVYSFDLGAKFKYLTNNNSYITLNTIIDYSHSKYNTAYLYLPLSYGYQFIPKLAVEFTLKNAVILYNHMNWTDLYARLNTDTPLSYIETNVKLKYAIHSQFRINAQIGRLNTYTQSLNSSYIGTGFEILF